jgi:hypothetical protein
MRHRWAAAGTAVPSAAALAVLGAVPADDVLTLRLRRLHDMHVEKVNQAVDEGREDLVRELSDAYADQALRAITAAGH